MSQPVTSSVAAPPTAASTQTITATAVVNPNSNPGGAGSGSILLPHPSPSLSAQAAGQLIRAVVLGPTADGQYIVDTRFGKFAIPLPNTPAAGTVLQLQIVKPGTPVELILLGGDARSPAPTPLIRLEQPPSALLTLTQAEVFRGVAVATAPDGRTLVDTRFGQIALRLANPPATGSGLQLQIAGTGTPLDLRLLAVEPPAAGASAAKGATGTVLSAGEIVVGRFVPTAGGAAASGGLAAGAFHAKIVAIHAAAPASAHDHNDAVISGRIASSQPGGPTVIETAAGRIVLPGVGSGAAGRFVTLQIVAEPGTVLPTNPNAAHLRSLMSVTQNWAALEQLIEAIQSSNPQLAAQFAASAVPNTGATLTAGIALFLSLLTRGQMPEWLGPEVVRLMESGNRQALLGQLGDDLGHMVRLAGEPGHGDWRVAMLPLLHNGQLHQIRLYLRQRQHGGDDAGQVAGTRFVVEASLSHLGDIQLDGLVRRLRFDLMVRTQNPLPEAMQREIAALFDEANQEFGVQGRIDFQVQTRFPVDPSDDNADHALGVYA